MSDFTSVLLVTAVRFLQQQQNVTATATDGDSSTDMMSPGPSTGVWGTNSPTEETVAPNMTTETTSGGSDHGAFEFIAFILWYLFLVLCCVIPTCCAYRRRRLMGDEYSQRQQAARNIAAGQYPSIITIEQLQQIQRMPHGLLLLNSLQRQDLMFTLGRGGGQSDLLLEGDVAKAERTRRLKESLDTTTFIVTQNDILQNNTSEGTGTAGGRTTSSNEEPKGANDATTSKEPQQQQEEESDDGGLFLSSSLVENASLLQLPHDTDRTQYVNANRTVPGVCAICLCEYEANDEVTWSKETGCQHAFHQDCIVPWLAKKNDAQPKCPCCRQVYAQIQPLTLVDLIDSNNIGSNDIEVGADGTPVTTTTNTATIHDTPRWTAGSLTALTPFQLDFIMRTGGSSFFPDDEEQQQQQQQQNQLQSGGVTLLDEDGGGGGDDDRENNNATDDDQEGTRPSSSSPPMDLEVGRDIERTGGVDESDNNDNNYRQRRTEQ
jgi:hypothetical protein